MNYLHVFEAPHPKHGFIDSFEHGFYFTQNTFTFYKGYHGHGNCYLVGTYEMSEEMYDETNNIYKYITFNYKNNVTIKTKIKITYEEKYFYNRLDIEKSIGTVIFLNNYLPDEYVDDYDNDCVFYIMDHESEIKYDKEGFENIKTKQFCEKKELENSKCKDTSHFSDKEYCDYIADYDNRCDELLKKHQKQLLDHVMSTLEK